MGYQRMWNNEVTAEVSFINDFRVSEECFATTNMSGELDQVWIDGNPVDVKDLAKHGVSCVEFPLRTTYYTGCDEEPV